MIEVEGLSLTYHTSGDSHLAVNDISFNVEKGQFYTLLGPSGCGKTTTLRCVAGLERPDLGTIRVDGRPVSSSVTGEWVSPNRRAIGMVFQSYAIWPHMTVYDNVAFPLRYGEERVPRRDIQTRVHKALEMVQLDGYVDRPAPHLSGGQQQRLALARAFVMEPKVLLLDEPLSNLDAKLREEMRIELRQLVKAMGMTTIFVTHEQIEALTLSDVIAVMSDGEIAQEGTPLEIYREPTNPFVANFIGQSNLLSGNVTELNGSGALDRRMVRVSSEVGNLACTAPAEIEVGDEIRHRHPARARDAPARRRGGGKHAHRHPQFDQLRRQFDGLRDERRRSAVPGDAASRTYARGRFRLHAIRRGAALPRHAVGPKLTAAARRID